MYGNRDHSILRKSQGLVGFSACVTPIILLYTFNDKMREVGGWNFKNPEFCITQLLDSPIYPSLEDELPPQIVYPDTELNKKYP